jgi:thiosulfate reductase/polysulfide reductase chain A
MPLDRREFIQLGGAGIGGVAALSGLTTNLWGLDPDVVHNPGTEGTKVVPTFCEICFWKCGVLAHVNDKGRVTKIEGNPDHPLSNGRLCPRGTGGHGLLYDPDRLRKPLLRKEKNGKQVFEEVSWDEALNFIAKKLGDIKTKHGPESVALFSHGYGASWFKRLMHAYGTPNLTHPSYAQCRGARQAGFTLTFGQGAGSPEATDIKHTRVMTLIGSHLGENMHNTQVQEMAHAIGEGGELIVVDPRYSVAAGKARYWLPVKPGTDIALLLAWIHVILKEGLYDHEYVAKYAIGLDALKAHVADKTPAWAMTETGVDAQKIIDSARFMAGAAPASLIHPGRRTAWYGDDTQRSRAIAILNALMGNWGRKGGFFMSTKFKLPKLKVGPKYPHDHRPPVDTPKGVVYPFSSSLLSHGVRDASIPGTSDYDIKAWIVYGTNLTQSLPDKAKTIEALKHLELSVVIDVLPAEICGWADVVLPEATYLERYDDIHTPGWRSGFASMRRPVVEPLYESKPGSWIAQELAKRMGLEAYFPWKDAEDYLVQRLKLLGLNLDSFKSGVVHAENAPVYIEDGLEPSFPTPSGKIELYSKQAEEAGLDPMPVYRRQPEAPAGFMRMLFGRTPTQTFSRTVNNRFLGEVYDENCIWVNARTATELGFEDGERVMLTNQDGAQSGPIAVKATQRIRPDCVYMVHGYGQKTPNLRFAKNKGASVATLMTKFAIDPAMGGTGMNTNFVKLEKVVVS